MFLQTPPKCVVRAARCTRVAASNCVVFFRRKHAPCHSRWEWIEHGGNSCRDDTGLSGEDPTPQSCVETGILRPLDPWIVPILRQCTCHSHGKSRKVGPGSILLKWLMGMENFNDSCRPEEILRRRGSWESDLSVPSYTLNQLWDDR